MESITVGLKPGQDEVPTSESAGVECVDVTKVYRGAPSPALDSINLTVPGGSITVLLGPSGCGKTTLLRCIAGLDTPTTGRIVMNGVDVSRMDAAQRDIAMVFQNYALYPNKTVHANIEFPLRMARVPKADRKHRVTQVGELLQLTQLMDRKPSQLSGGQRQRVGMGRAIVRNPGVLLMDEPLSNLDAELRVAMRAELLAVQRRLRMTVVFVTHDQTEALSLADQLVVMRQGTIEQAGDPTQVYAAPATTFVAGFLGGMNLLPIDAVTNQSFTDTFSTSGRPHRIGVRPEDLRLHDHGPHDIAFSGRVAVTELLGSDRLVHLDIGGQLLRARIRADVVVPERLTVHTSIRDLHFFDNKDQRIDTPMTGGSRL